MGEFYPLTLHILTFNCCTVDNIWEAINHLSVQVLQLHLVFLFVVKDGGLNDILHRQLHLSARSMQTATHSFILIINLIPGCSWIVFNRTFFHNYKNILH